jgi:hypothetical protein
MYLEANAVNEGKIVGTSCIRVVLLWDEPVP